MSLPLDLHPSPEAERLIRLIGSARVDLSTEAAAQRGLARLFEADGLAHQAEVTLSAADRIDFLVGRVGVEVKIGQPRREVLRQLERYAGSDRVDELLLVTAGPFPSDGFRAHGKPVFIVSLSTGWI